MSSWSGGGKRQSAGKGWRKKSSGPDELSHSWQSHSTGRARSPGRRWQSQWLVYSALGAVLLAVFLYVLLIRPAKTPVLLAIGVDYASPIPPNQWIFEDRDALVDLNETLAISDIAGSFSGKDSEGWKSFQALLSEHQEMRRGFRRVSEPLVVYFSMPGVVDENGAPCLLPSGTSPLDSQDWLRVEDIVAEIAKNVPAERPKLLIVDGNQTLINWKMGVVYNTFTERLKEFVNRCEVPNLAVLNSADAGEVSWCSPQLGGSAFGQFLRIGLAGAADYDSADPNGEVSVVELAEYLRIQVGNWAKLNRDSIQTPILLTTSEGLDFDLTHSLGGDVISSYRKTLADVSKVEPSIDIGTMNDLWVKLDRLRETDIVRYDPLVLARYECDLIRMEQMAYGGKAYKTEAERLSRDLKNRLEQAIARSENGGFSVADQWAIANPDDAATTRITHNLNSLALRRYFGQSDEAAIKRSQEFFKALTAAVNGMQPQSSDFSPSVVQSLSPFPETQLLVAAHRLKVLQQSSSAQYLRSVLDLRGRADLLAVPSIASTNPKGAQTIGDAAEKSTIYPGDERAHYFVRQAMTGADQERRLAQDALFAEGITDRSRLLSQANKVLSSVGEVQQQVSRALVVADRSMAQTPYLAEWIARDRGLAYSMASPREIDDLLQLIRDTQELSATAADLRQVHQSPDKVAEIANRLNVMAESIERRLNQYIDAFNEVCEQLGKAQVGAEMLSFESALLSPLIRAGLRKELLTKRDALAADLHRKLFEAEPASSSPEAAATSVAESIGAWQRPPLLTLLNVTDGPSSPGDELAALDGYCWAARKGLHELKELNVQGASSVDIASGNDAFLNDRLALASAERRIRSAASLWIQPPAVSPITRLRRFDLQQLLIWHAERTLDDFWHIVAEPSAKTIKELLAPPVSSTPKPELPGFADAAKNYLTCAEQINTPVPQGVNLQISAVKSLTDARRLASQYGIEQTATSRPVLNSPTEVEVEVEITPHPKGSNLPVGIASPFLVDEQNQLANISAADGTWGNIPLPIPAHEKVRQATRVRDVKSSALDSVVFFRGRQYRQLLEVNSLGGAVVQYEPPQYDSQSITLFGDQPNPPSVIFILDCSYSMDALIKTEIADAPMQPQMLVAKNALETMLTELAGRQGTPPRVGVMFFGHRVGWIINKENKTFKVSRKIEAAKNGIIPDDLSPAADVETVLPLGLFGAQEFGEVTARLENVTFHGITPVNLSIIKALEQFGPRDANYSKSIIVITDGKNDQSPNTAPGFRPVNTTQTDDVINAWNRMGKGIPIYIVGFGIDSNERDVALREFQKIAEVSNGKVVEPSSGADLIEYLRKQLSVQGYTVAAIDGERTLPVTKDISTGAESPVELNTRVEIPSAEFPLPMQFEVNFQSLAERVTLEGGEALEMRVARDGDHVEGVPYDADVVDEAPLVGDATTEILSPILRVHRPRRNDDRVKFRFSVQDEDAAFTPRPSELWIEVTPDGSTEPYVYYDPVYEPHTTVPVAGFTAANWPGDTDFARVKFWCGYKPTPPVLTIRLTDLPETAAGAASFQAVPQVPGVKVRVELENPSRGSYTVLVDEQLSPDSSASGAIRTSLTINDKSLQPRLVSHRIDAANRVARHQYDFRSNLSRREFAERVSVAVVSEAAIKKNCLHLGDENGLRVPVVDEDATLAPSTTSASF